MSGCVIRLLYETLVGVVSLNFQFDVNCEGWELLVVSIT